MIFSVNLLFLTCVSTAVFDNKALIRLLCNYWKPPFRFKVCNEFATALNVRGLMRTRFNENKPPVYEDLVDP